MGPFATATEFSEYTGMTLPSDLARLQAIIDDASAEIRGFTGQVLDQVVGDVFTSVPWTSSLIVLPQRPVTTISSIVVDAVTIPVADYTWTRGGHVWTSDGTSWGVATVTYSHGYAETSEEFRRIKVICMDVVKRAYSSDETGIATGHGSAVMETAGFPLQVFLSEGEMNRLSDYAATVFA